MSNCQIGITGGIGSGKTTICKIFNSLGIPTYHADERAKWLMSFNPELKKQIKQILGDKAYHSNGRLNRTFVAKKIFSDRNLKTALESIVHPAVQKDSEHWHKEQNSLYTIKEAALLVENDSYKLLDALIVVTAPEAVRIDRVVKRDGIQAEQVAARIRNQMREEDKVEVADYVIINDGNHLIIPQVIEIHRKIIEACAS